MRALFYVSNKTIQGELSNQFVKDEMPKEYPLYKNVNKLPIDINIAKGLLHVTDEYLNNWEEDNYTEVKDIAQLLEMPESLTLEIDVPDSVLKKLSNLMYYSYQYALTKDIVTEEKLYKNLDFRCVNKHFMCHIITDLGLLMENISDCKISVENKEICS